MGFDAHEDDPLTSLRLSSNSFGWLAEAVIRKGPALFVLEGGYSPRGLAEGSMQCLQSNAWGEVRDAATQADTGDRRSEKHLEQVLEILIHTAERKLDSHRTPPHHVGNSEKRHI